MDMEQTLSPGSLWQQLCARTDSALASGALQRIDTRTRIITDRGIPFLVRVAQNLQRKAEDKQQRDAAAADFNPFLPPEEALTVGAIGPEHLAVLNKFNVVRHHLLIVTRRYVPQEALLTLADFAALCWSLREIDGLGFYNGGTVAGASQRHKHLQLIPLPLDERQSGLPIEQCFPPVLPAAPSRVTALPFPHRIAALPDGLFDEPEKAAQRCRALYREMLAMLPMPPRQQVDYQSAPYNLLVTRRWLMLVPRSHEQFQSISINAMAFAGSLFVKNAQELAQIKANGPAAVLARVCE
jgi:ATP adenylyltransferase